MEFCLGKDKSTNKELIMLGNGGRGTLIYHIITYLYSVYPFMKIVTRGVGGGGFVSINRISDEFDPKSFVSDFPDPPTS